jgi:hypothetical protein
MRTLLAIVIAVVLGIFIGWMMCRSGCMPLTGGSYANPKEVNVVADSGYAYHIGINQKTVSLSKSLHESVIWTFDYDSKVDSVTAVFSGSSPFRSSRFSFADSAAFSGQPDVNAGPTVYSYTVTIYPHGHSPVTADPGIIIEM